MQHHLATGRTITAGLAPNTNLGGCQPSPVKVCWATPCHPLQHGSHPGVCFLSLILVPPSHLVNLLLNPAAPLQDRCDRQRATGRAGQRVAQPRNASSLSATPVVRHGEADHNGPWAWCFAVCVSQCCIACGCRQPRGPPLPQWHRKGHSQIGSQTCSTADPLLLGEHGE